MIIKGIDSYSPITQPIAERLANEGYKFVCRYLPGEGKRMTAEEAQILTDAGLLILSVYETTKNRAAGGAAYGKADGIAALQLAQKIHMPEHGCICFVVDFDAETSDINAIEAYFRAAKMQIEKYKIYCYGEYAVVEELARRGVCDGYWQAYAWSGGKTSTYNNLRQLSAPQDILNLDNDWADPDEAYTYRGLWNYNTTAESIALADELELGSPDYWGKVFLGRTALKPEYLKLLLQKAAEYGIIKLFENVIYSNTN